MKKLFLFSLMTAAIALASCKDEPTVTASTSTPGNGSPTEGTGEDTRGTTIEITQMPTAIAPATLWSNTEDSGDYDTDQTTSTTNEDYIESTSFTGGAITVTWSGASATVEGTVGGVEVSVQGGDVVVTSTAQGVRYVLTGSGSDGMFKVYSDYKYEVDLDGLTLTNSDGPALNLQSSKRAYIVLTDGTTSTLSDGSTYASSTEDQKGTVFANGKIHFSGSGTLNVTGNYKHAVASDDYISTRYGNVLNLTSTAADAIHTNDGLFVRGGTLTLKAEGNGIEVDKAGVNIMGGNIYITSGNDAVKTSYEGTDLSRSIRISGGMLAVITSEAKGHGLKSADSILVTGGVVRAYTYGNGAKGMKAEGNCVVRGGTITLCTTGAAYYDSSEKDVASATGIKAANFYMNNGTLRIAASGRGGKGISVDDYFTMNGGQAYVYTSGTGYSYNGDYTYAKGVRAEGVVNICAGDLVIAATGGDGSEGLESKSQVDISGGWVVVSSYDDGINAKKAINISGGNVYAYASGNDGIDSNGTILISDGTVVAVGTTSPEEGIDTDNNSNFSITGGTVIGVGGSGMRCYPQGALTQYCLYYAGTLSKGTALQLTDGSSSQLLLSILRDYSDCGLLFSSPDISKNTTYTLNTGGSITGSELNGYYATGTYTDGSQLLSFTPATDASGYLILLGNTSGGQGGGNPGTGGGPTNPGGPGGQGGGPGGGGGGGFR